MFSELMMPPELANATEFILMMTGGGSMMDINFRRTSKKHA
jgi:hypothetical protein